MLDSVFESSFTVRVISSGIGARVIFQLNVRNKPRSRDNAERRRNAEKAGGIFAKLLSEKCAVLERIETVVFSS